MAYTLRMCQRCLREDMSVAVARKDFLDRVWLEVELELTNRRVPHLNDACTCACCSLPLRLVVWMHSVLLPVHPVCGPVLAENASLPLKCFFDGVDPFFPSMV
jgi:hypothetical protein